MERLNLKRIYLIYWTLGSFTFIEVFNFGLKKKHFQCQQVYFKKPLDLLKKLILIWQYSLSTSCWREISFTGEIKNFQNFLLISFPTITRRLTSEYMHRERIFLDNMSVIETFSLTQKKKTSNTSQFIVNFLNFSKNCQTELQSALTPLNQLPGI